MKKRLIAAVAAVIAVFAGLAANTKPTPVFTTIYPLAVAQGLDQTVTISGSGFSRNTNIIVDGVAYGLSVQSPNSASFTFTPTMTQNVGFKSVQLKTANQVSQTLYFQVCDPVVITTSEIDMTVGQAIGSEGQIQYSGGCIWP